MSAARKSNRKNIIITYFLLSSITVMLVMILAYMGGYRAGSQAGGSESPVVAENGASGGAGGSGGASDGGAGSPGQGRQPSSDYTNDLTPPKPAESRDPAAGQQNQTNQPRNAKPKRLYIVLDDVGNDLVALEHFLALPFDITYAVMPKRRFSEEAARRIHRKGREVIVHQPMEPLGSNDPGPGALFTWMSKDAIFTQLKSNLETVPHAVGMNNHMGSKATSDVNVMSAVLDYLEEQDLFFLDSKTTADVAGQAIADARGWKYLQRNAMFLDNEKERESLEIAIRAGLEKAEGSGHAVMIGHVMTTELADALLEMYPDILKEGYEFDRLSEYFTGESEE